MTAKELAMKLNGREYGAEITRDEANEAAQGGVVVVYGYSDDNVEFSGAINNEVGCYGGATIFLTKFGILQTPDCEKNDCPYFKIAKKGAKKLIAKWNDEGNPCWSFKLDIAHETFEIFDDGELFCIGIVFSVDDL